MGSRAAGCEGERRSPSGVWNGDIGLFSPVSQMGNRGTRQSRSAQLAGRNHVWTLWSLCIGAGPGAPGRNTFTAGGEACSRGVGR